MVQGVALSAAERGGADVAEQSGRGAGAAARLGNSRCVRKGGNCPVGLASRAYEGLNM